MPHPPLLRRAHKEVGRNTPLPPASPAAVNCPSEEGLEGTGDVDSAYKKSYKQVAQGKAGCPKCPAKGREGKTERGTRTGTWQRALHLKIGLVVTYSRALPSRTGDLSLMHATRLGLPGFFLSLFQSEIGRLHNCQCATMTPCLVRVSGL
eukprot:1156662-Pelagomonas_calceolata.AAC.8